jgi:hypothetical protein
MLSGSSSEHLERDHRSRHKIDDETERRPPSRIRHEVPVLLKDVAEVVELNGIEPMTS